MPNVDEKTVQTNIKVEEMAVQTNIKVVVGMAVQTELVQEEKAVQTKLKVEQKSIQANAVSVEEKSIQANAPSVEEKSVQALPNSEGKSVQTEVSQRFEAMKQDLLNEQKRSEKLEFDHSLKDLTIYKLESKLQELESHHNELNTLKKKAIEDIKQAHHDEVRGKQSKIAQLQKMREEHENHHNELKKSMEVKIREVHEQYGFEIKKMKQSHEKEKRDIHEKHTSHKNVLLLEHKSTAETLQQRLESTVSVHEDKLSEHKTKIEQHQSESTTLQSELNQLKKEHDHLNHLYDLQKTSMKSLQNEKNKEISHLSENNDILRKKINEMHDALENVRKDHAEELFKVNKNSREQQYALKKELEKDFQMRQKQMEETHESTKASVDAVKNELVFAALKHKETISTHQEENLKLKGQLRELRDSFEALNQTHSKHRRSSIMVAEEKAVKIGELHKYNEKHKEQIEMLQSALDEARRSHSLELNKLVQLHNEEKADIHEKHSSQKEVLYSEHDTEKSALKESLVSKESNHQQKLEKHQEESSKLRRLAKDLKEELNSLTNKSSSAQSSLKFKFENLTRKYESEQIRFREEAKQAEYENKVRTQKLELQLQQRKEAYENEVEALNNAHKTKMSALTSKFNSEHESKIRALLREHKKVVHTIAKQAKKKSTEEIGMQIQASANDHSVWLEFEVNRIKQAYEAEFSRLQKQHADETESYKMIIGNLKRSKKSLLEDVHQVKGMYVEGYKKQVEDNSTLYQERESLKAKVEDLQVQIKVAERDREELNSKLMEKKLWEENGYDIESAFKKTREEKDDLQKIISELNIQNAIDNAELEQLKVVLAETKSSRNEELENLRKSQSVSIDDTKKHFQNLIEDLKIRTKLSVEEAESDIKQLIVDKKMLKSELNKAQESNVLNESEKYALEEHLKELMNKQNEIKSKYQLALSQLDEKEIEIKESASAHILGERERKTLEEAIVSLRTTFKIKTNSLLSQVSAAKRENAALQKTCSENFLSLVKEREIAVQAIKKDIMTDPFWFAEKENTFQKYTNINDLMDKGVQGMKEDLLSLRAKLQKREEHHLKNVQQIEIKSHESMKSATQKFNKTLEESMKMNGILRQKIEVLNLDNRNTQEKLSKKLKRVTKKLRETEVFHENYRAKARKQSQKSFASTLSLQKLLGSLQGKRAKEEMQLPINERRKNDPFWFVIQDFGVHVQSPDGKVSKVRWQGRVDGKRQMSLAEFQKLERDSDLLSKNWFEDMSQRGSELRR